MRNIGGSIGISVTSTLLTRRSDVHQNELTNYVPQSGQAFENGAASRIQALSGHFGTGHAGFPADARIYQELQYQATNWAFVDVFRWLALLCFFCIVVVWFFKKVRPTRPSPSMAAH
jgi:DHA2 family multidrug resistance protein